MTPDPQRNLVYIEGGPLGDVCHQHVDFINDYDDFARDYYVNEGQYGFVPAAVAVAGGSRSASNAYFNGLVVSNEANRQGVSARFDSRDLDNFGYLRLIGGNMTLANDQVALYCSFAFSMLTADRTAWLVQYLAKQANPGTISLLGESYGMTAGLETIIQHPDTLNLLQGAELGRNVLAKGGGTPTAPVDNNNDGIDDSTVEYGDGHMIASVSYNATTYGYIDRLTNLIGSSGGSAFLDNLRNKVTFGFSTDDNTIGPMPQADKVFYAKNGITPVLSTGGHGAFFLTKNILASLLKVDANAAQGSYDYAGFNTTKRARYAGTALGCTVGL